MSEKTIAVLGLCLLVLSSVAVAASQQPTQASFTLVKIDLIGAKRYAKADVVRLSGLKDGQTITPPDLDGVARRLSATGLFTSVKYRYLTSGSQLSVIFEIEEETWTMPVVFDNFVWFTDAELTTELRQAVPSFDGTAPANAGVSGLMTQELQRILEARHLPGHVDFTPHVDLITGAREYRFGVKDAGAALRICALRVDGASGVPEKDLQEAAALTGTDYSRSLTVALTRGSLVQVYRRRGFWKAAFGPPTASPDAGGGCGGVSVTLHVTEGMPYTWERAEWAGNAAIPAKDLDAAMGMKPGEVADVSKMEAGLRAVNGAYGKQGYMAQSQKLTPRVDDASHSAVFVIDVKEGAQYHMGALDFVGFPPADEANLRKKWRLQPGDVYDASYPDRFRIEAFSGGRGPAGHPVGSELRIDPTALKVDVRLVLK